MEFLHVCLNVADADHTASWYVDQLGFDRTWEFTTDDGDRRNVYVAADDGTEIQLSDAADQDALEPGTGWDHLAVSVDDVDAAFERIDHHGVEREPTDIPAAEARVAFVRDPDGHLVELIEPFE